MRAARIQALHMAELLGQSIVVENVGAAAGQARQSAGRESPPDG